MELHLHEQLLLLALNDDKGTMQGQSFEVGAAGAILAELLLHGQLAIEAVKKKQFIVIARNEATDDPLMDEIVQRIRTAKKRNQVSGWVAKIAGTKKLRHRIADRLRHRGVLGKAEGRVLWIFTRTLYPTLNPEPERELVARLRAAVFAEGEIEAQTAVMLALAHTLGLTRYCFTKPELKERKQRLKQVEKLEVVSAEAKAALAGVQAVLAAQRAAAVAAATAG